MHEQPKVVKSLVEGVTPPRYSLEHGGRLLELEAKDVGLGHAARLFLDGQLRDEQKARSERAELQADGFLVQVKWGDFGGVKRCVLVTQDGNGRRHDIPFEPPPESHAARMAQFGHKHPHLYAARHLVKPVLQALVPLLGLGALLTALLPRFDWTWLPPFVRDKLFGDGPAWLEPLLDSPVVGVGKWVVPIVLALFVARDEYEKHQKTRKDTYGPHR